MKDGDWLGLFHDRIHKDVGRSRMADVGGCRSAVTHPHSGGGIGHAGEDVKHNAHVWEWLRWQYMMENPSAFFAVRRDLYLKSWPESQA